MTTTLLRRLLPPVLSLLLLAHVVSALSDTSGEQITTGSFNARALGKTEGCFNSFAALLIVYFKDDDVLSNAKCQSLCGDHGFVTAATTKRSCQCGNIYPSIYSRVDDRRCNAPCSFDRSTCRLSSCCGDAVGKFFTVSFAAEIEPRRELLRRLAFDYRENSPTFREYVEGLMAQTTALQVLRSSSSMSSTATNANATSMSGPAAGTFVGLGEGCPTGWQGSGDSCYKATVGGTPVTQEEAQASCVAAGGMLASVTTANHNAVTKKLLQGQTGWIGLTTSPHPAGYSWGWEPFAAWDVNQPDWSSFARRSPDAYGPVSGGEFDDYTRDVAGLSSLTLGFTLGSIISLQATYRLKSGKTLTTPVRGGEARSFETLTLNPGDRITKVEGVTNSNAFQGLTITITDYTRRTRTWGPIGSAAKPTFTYRPASEVIALYGRYGAKALYQLGFHEYVGMACGQVNDQGLWEAVYCEEKAPAPFYLCEKPQAKTRRDCPLGWANFGLSCFKSVQSEVAMSWLDAAAACRGQGGWLARLDSAAKREAAWALMQGARGFIGLRDWIASSEDALWDWDRYENWAPDQPEPVLDADGKVDAPATCALMHAQTGQWRTVGCREYVPGFIPLCEAPALDDECACPHGWVAQGCSCFYYGGATASGPDATNSWLDMQAFCAGLTKGGSLPLPRTAAINAALVKAVATQAAAATAAGVAPIVFLGLRDTFGKGALIPEVYTAWGGGSEPTPAAGLCGVMRPDGSWYGQDCLTRLKAFVCRLPRAATAAYVGGEGQHFAINLIPGQSIEWGAPLDVEIAQAATGHNLAVDLDGNVFPLLDGEAAGASPSSSVSTRFTFAVAADGSSSSSSKDAVGAFVLRSKDHGSYLFSDPSTGQLRALRPPASQAGAPPLELVRAGYASLFSASEVVPALGVQNLALSLVAMGNADAGPMLCSMYIYDLTPESTSFRCYEVQGDATGLPQVSLEMAAWTNQDKASILSPRVPLDLGRTVCENESAEQSSTCSTTYGQALGVATTMNILNGYMLQDTYQVSYLNPAGNFWNLAILRTNTYTDITTVQYLQTNQYSSIIPVPPQSSVTVQYWQSTVSLNYVWNALFTAVGSFQLSSLGLNLGPPRSLTTVSSPRDLLFYLWGHFRYPTQGEVTITSNLAPVGTYPFDRPEMNNARG